jgi:hypothetical protein
LSVTGQQSAIDPAGALGKVEMSKLPFRQMAEAEIGIFDDE